MEQAAFITVAAGTVTILAGYGIARLESKFRAMFPKKPAVDNRIHTIMPNW